MVYRVFISHGWHDRWIAKQIARCIREEAGGEPFIDIFDIAKGDRIEARIRDGLSTCDELVALITPWSVERNWVWAEMSAVWALEKRFTAVLYGISLREIDEKHGGSAILQPTNVASIDETDDYLRQLRHRVAASASELP